MKKLCYAVLIFSLLAIQAVAAADSGYIPISTDTSMPVDIGQVPPYEGELSAKSAVLIDALTGRVLFA